MSLTCKQAGLACNRVSIRVPRATERYVLQVIETRKRGHEYGQLQLAVWVTQVHACSRAPCSRAQPSAARFSLTGHSKEALKASCS